MNADMGRATDVEVDLYNELLDNMMEELDGMPKKHPDLLIHINVSYETMIKRIKNVAVHMNRSTKIQISKIIISVY